MAERNPTIEQKSHFSAKTKQGQDVEFEAVLRFFVSPTGEVKISAPGASSVGSVPGSTTVSPASGGAGSALQGPPTGQQGVGGPPTGQQGVGGPPTGQQGVGGPPTGSVSVGSQDRSTTIQPSAPSSAERPPTSQDQQKQMQGISPGGSGESKSAGGQVEIPSDKSLEKAWPQSPPSNCPITQFIPDPCRAVDDLQKTIKRLFSSFFSGRDCPPPQNADYSLPGESKITPRDVETLDTSKENKTESEAIKNEEKYDV